MDEKKMQAGGLVIGAAMLLEQAAKREDENVVRAGYEAMSYVLRASVADVDKECTVIVNVTITKP